MQHKHKEATTILILYVYDLLQNKQQSKNKSGTFKMKENFNKQLKNRTYKCLEKNAHLLLFFKLYKAKHRLEGNTALGVRTVGQKILKSPSQKNS